MMPIEPNGMLTYGNYLLDVDSEQAAKVAENEFYISKCWAYKWPKRFVEFGLEGLKILPRDSLK